jgi:hypothetical protein
MHVSTRKRESKWMVLKAAFVAGLLIGKRRLAVDAGV